MGPHPRPPPAAGDDAAKKIKLEPAPSPKPESLTPISVTPPPSSALQIKSAPQRAFECRNLIRETIGKLISTYGTPTLDISIGDPTKFGGTFSVPSPLRESIIDVVNEGKYDGYTHSVGDEGTRRALAKHYGIEDYTHVAITSGCSSALDLTLRSLAGHDDLVLVPAPGFPLYETLLKLNAVGYARYRLDPSKDWEADLNSFETIVAAENRIKVKAVIVCNPSNPTGSVYSESHLREVILKVKQLFPFAVVIADQVYEDVVFSLTSRFVDMGKLGPQLNVPVIAVSGVAKGYHAPGWRMGWILSYDSHEGELDAFRKCVQNLSNTTMGATTLLQHALRRVLESRQEEMKVFRQTTDKVLRESCKILCDGLARIRGVEVSEPKGAMYLFFKMPPVKSSAGVDEEMSSYDVCVELLKQEKLLLLPGDECFGAPRGYCRLLMAVPPEVAKDAVERITRFCERNCVY